MEMKMNTTEFVEFMGGERRATNLLDDLCKQILADDKQLDVALSNNKIAFSVCYTKIESKNKPPFGLAIMLYLKRELEDDKSTTDIVTPWLIYVTEANNEMPDCCLDMISFAKKMNEQETIEMSWVREEMKKFK